MTFNQEVWESRMAGSNYDPVIWEDIIPLEKKLEALEMLVNDLADIIIGYVPGAASEVKELIDLYDKTIADDTKI